VVEQNVHSALIASRAYVFETGRVVAESSAVNISVIPICSAPISVLEETRFEV
jgi:ABC-type branched-subunit amino acid transport system ATPase component